MATVTGLLFGACGDDNDDVDGSAEAYIEAFVVSNEGRDDMSKSQTTCVAAALIDVIGVDALNEADVSPEEFATEDSYGSLGVELPDDATADLGDAFNECVVVEKITNALFVEAAEAEIPPDGVACMADHLDDQAVLDGLAAEYMDGSTEQLITVFIASMGACPSAMTAALIAEAPTELTPEAEACIGAFVQDNLEVAADIFTTTGATHEAASEEFGELMAAACGLEIFGG